MNEDQALEITKRVMSDTKPIRLTINIMELWMIVGHLQLASRHPSLSDTLQQFVRHTCDQFIDAIAAKYPEAREVLEMGYDPTHDIPQD